MKENNNTKRNGGVASIFDILI